MQKEVTVTDGSAMLTGVLLALNLPVTLPLWEAAIGCVFAVAVVKQLFGGLGCNFANPAITGRVFLLLSFGGDMTTWVKPFYYQGNNFIVKLLMDNPRIPDGVTGATPLASGNANLLDLFLGNVGGSLGETSALANMVTKDKIAAAEADAIQSSLQQLPDAGTFEEITDFTPENNEKATATGLYQDEKGQFAVLVTADGYNKGGLQVVIGVDKDGAVTGVSFVTVSETPGLGTKVQSNPELLVDNLVGLSDETVVNGVDNITGATYSSKGMKAAVNCALATVSANQEVTGA